MPDYRSGPEQSNTPLALYNNSSSDLAYAEAQAIEVINISGAYTTIYIKEPAIDQEDIDGVWDEDANPLYRPGIIAKGFVKVNPYNFELTRWGVDAPLKLTIVYARAALFQLIGNRLINLGDVIEVPYNDPKIQGPARFRVLNAFDTGMWKYRWLYYSAQVELLTGDLSLRVTHQRNSNIR